MSNHVLPTLKLSRASKLPSYARLVFETPEKSARQRFPVSEYLFSPGNGKWQRVWFSRGAEVPAPEALIELSGCLVNAAGTVISPDGERLWGPDFGLGAKGLQSPTPVTQKALSGTYIYGLNQHVSFGHWLIHRLPRIYSALQHNEGTDVLISSSPWDPTDLIQSVGVRKEQMIALPADKREVFFQVDKILVANHAAPPGRRRQLDWPRFEKVVSQILNNLRLPDGKRGPEKIYLTRTTAPEQRLGCMNRPFIENLMKQSGYFVVAPETLPFREQVNLLVNAKDVVTEAGSGGLLSVFSRRLRSLTYLSPQPNYEISNWNAQNSPWARSIALAKKGSFRFASVSAGGDYGSWNADEQLLQRLVRNL